MEGSCTRSFPRMSLDQPVEIQLDGRTIRTQNPGNNLSVGGLFVSRGDLPVGAHVRVRIAARRVFEADGQIRNCDPRAAGVGIGFTSLSNASRDALYDLVEDLTLRGLPAA